MPNPNAGFGIATIPRDAMSAGSAGSVESCEFLMTNQFERSLLQLAPESVLAGLPQHLLDIPRLITDATGIHVQVLPSRQEAIALAAGVEQAPLLLDLNAKQQSIKIWCGQGPLTSALIGHKLIHLRRAVLESIPRLVPDLSSGPWITGEITLMESELEHLFVIPEEISTFPDAEQYWADNYQKVIQKSADSGSPEALCFHWAQIRNSLPDQLELAQTLDDHLRCLGGNWHKYAGYLEFDIKQAMADKDALHAIIHNVRDELRPHMGTARFSTVNGSLGFQPLSFAGKYFTEEA